MTDTSFEIQVQDDYVECVEQTPKPVLAERESALRPMQRREIA